VSNEGELDLAYMNVFSVPVVLPFAALRTGSLDADPTWNVLGHNRRISHQR
jgi:hypothetical protein